MGLPCVNCKRDIAENEAEFFAGILVCKDCNRVATHLCERAHKELKWLLLMHQELIRNAIVQGKLQLQVQQGLEEVSRDELLEALAKMARQAREEQERECPLPLPTTRRTVSKESTTSNARTLDADGKPSSDSNSE